MSRKLYGLADVVADQFEQCPGGIKPDSHRRLYSGEGIYFPTSAICLGCGFRVDVDRKDSDTLRRHFRKKRDRNAQD